MWYMCMPDRMIRVECIKDDTVRGASIEGMIQLKM